MLVKSDSGRFCPRIYTTITITINPRTTAIETAIRLRSGHPSTTRLKQQLGFAADTLAHPIETAIRLRSGHSSSPIETAIWLRSDHPIEKLPPALIAPVSS